MLRHNALETGKRFTLATGIDADEKCEAIIDLSNVVTFDPTNAGTYYDTLVKVNGCDSVIITSINVLNWKYASITTSICLGDTISVGNLNYSATGGHRTFRSPHLTDCLEISPIRYHWDTSRNPSVSRSPSCQRRLRRRSIEAIPLRLP